MKQLLFAVLPAALFALPAQAALINYINGSGPNLLTGNVTNEGWTNMTTARINPTTPYGAHGTTAAWTQSLVSNEGAQAGNSSLMKNSGYGYIGATSLHQGFPGFTITAGGNFSISGSAIAGLETLVFQIQATDRAEQVFDALPSLTIGSTVVGAADFVSLYGTIDNYATGFGGQDMDFYAFQWDLSSLSIPDGEAFSINWTGLTNSGIFELQLNQGDTFTQVVPEPSTSLLGAGALGLAFLRRRRA